MMHLTGELAAEWREKDGERERERKRERHVLTQRHTSMKMECLRKQKNKSEKARELLGERECVR